VVVDVGEEDGRPYAVLEDTVFYPEGGGQPADSGLLGGTKILDVQKAGDEIRHYLSIVAELGPVRLELDWRRRWDHMQQHTAQHVLTAVAQQQFDWRTTAFYLGSSVSDIELDVPRLEGGDLARLEGAVAEEVRAARTIAYRSAEVAAARSSRAKLDRWSAATEPWQYFATPDHHPPTQPGLGA
jgi:alanyl-tRNA synthetase